MDTVVILQIIFNYSGIVQCQTLDSKKCVKIKIKRNMKWKYFGLLIVRFIWCVTKYNLVS
jgi:hypothetical protein